MQDTVHTLETTSGVSHNPSHHADLFSHCRNTFEAFQGLGDVAENMRILSLNAELAAGRAGSYGVSIRALTQYTRELVNRLEQINLEMAKIEAFQTVKNDDDDAATPDDSSAENAVVEAATEEDTVALMQRFSENHGGVKYLNEQAKRIAEVVSQSNSIATNMAIEAATAGQYEETFTNVANDMRGFVDTLKSMVTKAQDSIEKAFRSEKALKDLDAVS